MKKAPQNYLRRFFAFFLMLMRFYAMSVNRMRSGSGGISYCLMRQSVFLFTDSRFALLLGMTILFFRAANRAASAFTFCASALLPHYFFASAYAVINAVMGMERITPMLLEMPLMTSMARYAELRS